MSKLSFAALTSLLFYGVYALAQVVAPTGAPVVVTPPVDLPPADYLSQLFDAVKTLGGLPWAGKVIIICNLVIASMRVSIVRTWIWDKMGSAQFLAGPLLALVGGIIGHFTAGVPLTFTNLVAYFMAGAGSILLHQTIDGIREWPGSGHVIDWVESTVSGLLGKMSLAAPPPPPPAA